MDPQPHQENTLGLEQALRVLRRRLPVIGLCFVLVAGSAFAFSKLQTKKYTATASLVFNNAQVSQQVAGLQVSNDNEPKADQETNVKLLELSPAAAQTAKVLGQGLAAATVQDDLEISAEGESNVVSVSATALSPALATKIANTYANRFVADQLDENHRYFGSALAVVEHQLGALSPAERVGQQGLALQDRAQSLSILAQLKAGDVQVAQEATVPTSPSSPKTTRNTALGMVIGLLLGIGIAFLLERLDRRMKQPEDMERIFELPLLGVISESDAYPRHAAVSVGERGAPLPEAEVEAFHMLRARLRYFNVDRNLRVLIVTSASKGDGKTTVVQNLAEAAASMGGRVLLIEADLRRPELARRLALRRSPGLAEVLISASTAEEAIQELPMTGHGSANGGQNSLGVLAAGITPPNPAALIESQAMEHLLEWATGAYDLVLIDTPPLSFVPDAIPLLRRSDGVVIVSRLGKSTRDAAARMRDELRSLGAPVLGVVANGFKARDIFGYGYGYGYYTPNGAYTRNGNDSDGSAPAADSVPANGSASIPADAAAADPAPR